MIEIIQLKDSELSRSVESDSLNLLNEAFEGDFSQEDFRHTFGGLRFLGYFNQELVAHGSVIPRNMCIDEIQVQVGYIEGVAVIPKYWKKGFGSLLIAEITSYCRSQYSISMLSTVEKNFYSRHGWVEFEGESYVLSEGRELSTKEENETLMFLMGTNLEARSLNKAVCNERTGDAW